MSRSSTALVMAEFIKQAGIPFFSGYPGTSNIEFMEGARQRGVDTVLARREATAAFMAEGLAMASGLPGVCISTLGPGSTALVNGVAADNLDRVPMVAMSGQIGSAREPYFTHQVVDHNRLFAPITKWAGRVEPRSVATIMRKALRLATAERPGAVHLTTNADIAKAEALDDEVRLPPMAPAVETPQIFRADSDLDPSALLARARRPVLAGIGAMRAGARRACRAGGERGGAGGRVADGQGRVAEDHPYFAGVIDMACNQVIWDLLGGADLVLAVGFDPVGLIKPWAVDASVLHIDTVPNVDQVYAADVEIVGAVPVVLSWLAAGFRGQPRWSEAAVDRHRRTLRTSYYEGRVEGRVNPTDVVDTLRAAAPRHTFVTTDVGSHKLLVGQGWTTYEPRASLMSNGLSSMGFSLPAAIGAKLVGPARPVVCVLGDGGFAMVQGELRLAESLGLGMAVVALCDQSLNRIETVKHKVRESMGLQAERDYTVTFRVYGRDGCLGRLEPEAHAVSHEVGLLIDVVAPDQAQARGACAIAWHTTLHHPVPGWSGLVSNVAFPYSPPHSDLGPVYEFTMNHVVALDDPLEVVSIAMERVGS